MYRPYLVPNWASVPRQLLWTSMPAIAKALDVGQSTISRWIPYVFRDRQGRPAKEWASKYASSLATDSPLSGFVSRRADGSHDVDGRVEVDDGFSSRK